MRHPLAHYGARGAIFLTALVACAIMASAPTPLSLAAQRAHAMNCYKCTTPVPDNSRFCLSCGADLSGEHAERTLAVEADPEPVAKLQAALGGDFIIERELGRGGMAIVFLTRDAHLGRKVAIKILPPELTFGTGPVERFKREARTSATLDHPHIIPIHRVSTGGTLF